MKYLIPILTLLTYVSSARLDHLQYLPPHTNSVNQNSPVAHHNQPLDATPTDYLANSGQELEPNFGQGAPYKKPPIQFNSFVNDEPATVPPGHFGGNQEEPGVSFKSSNILNASRNQEYPEVYQDSARFIGPQDKNSQFKGPNKSQLHPKQQNFKDTSTFFAPQIRPSNAFQDTTFQNVLSTTPLGVEKSTFDAIDANAGQLSQDRAFLPVQLQPQNQLLQTYGSISQDFDPKTAPFSQNPFLQTPESTLNQFKPTNMSPAFQNLNPVDSVQFETPNSIGTNIKSPSTFDGQDVNGSSQPEDYRETENFSRTSLNENPHFESLTTEAIPILRSVNTNNQDGTYQYAYQTANDITAFEEGDARFDGTKAQGYYGYTSPEGKKIEVTYTADERGFIPQGDHLPTAPPVPKAILKALEYIKKVEEEKRLRGEVLDDGQYREEYSTYDQKILQKKQRFNYPNEQEEDSSFGDSFQKENPNKDQFNNNQNNLDYQSEDQINQNEPRNQNMASEFKEPSNFAQENNEPSFLPFSDSTLLGVGNHQDPNFSLKNGAQSSTQNGSLLNNAKTDYLGPQGTHDVTNEGYKY